jgi:homoprotocatechuate degradation regulator HpaR
MRERKSSGTRSGLRDDRRSLPIALLRAREAVMQHFRPLHRRGKTTEQQWRVIRVLHFDGEMDAGELARRSYLLAPSLSRILRDLEAQGYLRRRPGDVDSRQSLLSLSPKASSMVAGVASRLDRIHDEIAARFGSDRLEDLLALLAELEQALDPPTKKTEGNACDDKAPARRRPGPVRNLGARAGPQ